MVEGEKVLTLRLEVQGGQKLFVDASGIRQKVWPPLVEEDWIVLCQAQCQQTEEEEWNEMREKEVKRDLQEKFRCNKSRPESGWIRKAGLEEVAERRFLLCRRIASSSFR